MAALVTLVEEHDKKLREMSHYLYRADENLVLQRDELLKRVKP